MIAPGTLQVAKATANVIKLLQYLNAISQMRSFLGLCNGYRRFVSRFSKIGPRLNRKLKEGEFKESCSDNQDRRAVNGLKNRLFSPPVFALPRAKGQYTVDTDAQDTQIRCIVLQERGKKVLKPFDYWSSPSCVATHRYKRTHKNCLAVVGSVLMLRP